MSQNTHLFVQRSPSSRVGACSAVSVAYASNGWPKPTQYAMAFDGGTWLCTPSERLVRFISRGAAHLAAQLRERATEHLPSLKTEDMAAEARMSLLPIGGGRQVGIILESVEPIAFSYANSSAGAGSIVRLHIGRYPDETLAFLDALADLSLEVDDAARYPISNEIRAHEIIPADLWNAGSEWRGLAPDELRGACRHIYELGHEWEACLGDNALHEGLLNWLSHQGIDMALNNDQPSVEQTLFAQHLGQSVAYGRYTIEQLAQTYNYSPAAVRDCIRMAACD